MHLKEQDKVKIINSILSDDRITVISNDTITQLHNKFDTITYPLYTWHMKNKLLNNVGYSLGIAYESRKLIDRSLNEKSIYTLYIRILNIDRDIFIPKSLKNIEIHKDIIYNNKNKKIKILSINSLLMSKYSLTTLFDLIRDNRVEQTHFEAYKLIENLLLEQLRKIKIQALNVLKKNNDSEINVFGVYTGLSTYKMDILYLIFSIHKEKLNLQNLSIETPDDALINLMRDINKRKYILQSDIDKLDSIISKLNDIVKSLNQLKDI